MDEYDDGLYWAILLMYGSHDMRHTSFRRLTVVNGTPGFWGVTNFVDSGTLTMARITNHICFSFLQHYSAMVFQVL